ncbi:MAG: UxaA family hydrolase [Halodesulfurarchaeum sp.]
MKGETIGDVGLVMSDIDNVATALDDLSEGREIDAGADGSLRLEEDVEFGHKFALVPIDAGETVYKYGEVIGRATSPIEAGEWVHTHNIESTRGRGDQDDSSKSEGVA